jgi:hypothetical protein
MACSAKKSAQMRFVLVKTLIRIDKCVSGDTIPSAVALQVTRTASAGRHLSARPRRGKRPYFEYTPAARKSPALTMDN